MRRRRHSRTPRCTDRGARGLAARSARRPGRRPGPDPHSRPRTLQGALDRRRRRAEHDRNLGGGERQHIAENQDGPLPRRKMLQAGDERQPQSLTRRDDGRGITRGRGHHRIRHRLQPAHLCPGLLRKPRGIRFRVGQAGWQRSPAMLGQLGQAPFRGDLVQPGTYRRPSFEPAVGPPGAHVCLLDHVLRILDRAEHAVAVREQLTPQRLGLPDEVSAIGHEGSVIPWPEMACASQRPGEIPSWRSRERLSSIPHASVIRPSWTRKMDTSSTRSNLPAGRRVPAPGTQVRTRAAEATDDRLALGDQFDDLHLDVREALAKRRDPAARTCRHPRRVELVDEIEVTGVDDALDEPPDDGLAVVGAGLRGKAHRRGISFDRQHDARTGCTLKPCSSQGPT